jgi:DNA-binding HxlR family transcriptional regulator
MHSGSFDKMVCSIAGALDLLVDRRAVVILRDLMFGLSKYQDFLRSTELQVSRWRTG